MRKPIFCCWPVIFVKRWTAFDLNGIQWKNNKASFTEDDDSGDVYDNNCEDDNDDNDDDDDDGDDDVDEDGDNDDDTVR